MFWGLSTYWHCVIWTERGCLHIPALAFQLPNAYPYNHSLTATTVTTQWSKPQICFCSDIYKDTKYYEWRELNIAEKCSGFSCHRNKFGKCRSCACVKASRCCTNCLPSRLGQERARYRCCYLSCQHTSAHSSHPLYLCYHHPPCSTSYYRPSWSTITTEPRVPSKL